MDRQHRRELKHDKFVDEIGALSIRARENQRTLYLTAGAVLAVALIAFGIYFFRSSRERKAQTLLGSAISTIESPLIQPAPAENPPTAKFKTEAERTAAAEKEFKELQNRYGGSDAADVANLYLARIHASRGDSAGARKLLESFVNEHGDHLLVGPARYSLYQLRIESGESQQVATEINAELTKQEPVLPSDSLLSVLAHAYDAQGNGAKAKETYRRIATEFPDSPYALEAQRRIGSSA